MKRVALKIYGNVQGVFYRFTAKEQAEKLNITGWVKNESDGTVSIVAEGKEGDLKKFIELCYNGTESARVEKIEEKWSEATGKLKKFEIKF